MARRKVKAKPAPASVPCEPCGATGRALPEPRLGVNDARRKSAAVRCEPCGGTGQRPA